MRNRPVLLAARAASTLCNSSARALPELGGVILSQQASLQQGLQQWELRAISSASGSSSQAGSSDGDNRWNGLAVLAGIAAAGSYALGPALAEAPAEAKPHPAAEETREWSMLSLSQRQRIFFKYEKRIRDKSSLEKVFDYFSSNEKGGVKYMNSQDLLAAVVPTYPPSQSKQERAGFLDGERPRGAAHDAARTGDNIFRQFDIDGDGLVSYGEFLLVLTLLSIPEQDVATIFDVVDLDGNGNIDAQEFKVVMQLLQGQCGSVGAHHTAGRHGLDAEGDQASGMLVSFFGADQKGVMKLKQFMDFLRQLHEDLVRLEFGHYDVTGSGSVPGVDFARSLVAAADVKHIDGLLDRVDSLPEPLRAARISWRDFSALHSLHRKTHALGVALDFMDQVGRPVSRPELSKLLSKLLGGVTLSEQALDIICHLFKGQQAAAAGAGAVGCLDTRTLMEVLQKRASLGRKKAESAAGGRSEGSGASSWFACMKKCKGE